MKPAILEFHPVIRYAAILTCLLLAASTVVISGIVNPYSISWLLGFYITGGALLLALRQWRSSDLYTAYSIYLVMFQLYLLVVWVLHIVIPGGHPQEAKEVAHFAMRYFGAGGIYMAVAIYHFTLRFSESTSKILKVIGLLGWIIAFGFHASQLGGFFFDDFIWTGQSWVPTMGAQYPIFFGYISFFVTLGMGVPLFKAFSHTSRIRRRQLIFYLIGALPLWISCWTHFLMSMGIRLFPMGGIFLAIHVLIIAYAVMGARIYDMTIIIRKGLPYALISVLFGISFGGAMVLARYAFQEHSISQEIGLNILLLIATGLLYAPLILFFQSMVDKIFFRDRANREQLFTDFTRGAQKTLELDQLQNELGQVLYRALEPTWVTLFTKDSNSNRLEFFGVYKEGMKTRSADSDKALEDGWRVWLEDHTPKTAIITHRKDFEKSPLVERGIVLDEGSERLVIPIQQNNEVLGYAVLGPKRSDTMYSEEEMLFAEASVAHSAIALLNAQRFKQVRYLQSLMRGALQGLPSAVVLVRPNGKIELNNPALELLMKESPPSKPLTHLSELRACDPDLGEFLEGRLEAADEFENLPVRWLKPEERFLMTSMRKISDDKESSIYLFVLHDLSEFKKLEDSFKRQESLAQIGIFVSSINHELRNVIHPIRNVLVRIEKLNIEHPDYRDAVSDLPDRMGGLDRLLNNLRNYARPIELRRMNVGLEDLLISVEQDLQDLFSEHFITLTREIHSSAQECFLDGDWMKQVFYNLIKNAAEATLEMECRTVKVTARGDGEQVIIAIEDSGKGIPEGDLGLLFEPFFSTKGQHGTGLGLSLCRKIVELHNGALNCRSTPGIGTVFEISLPRADHDASFFSKSSESGFFDR